MYLARYRDDQQEIVQAIARFEAVVLEPPDVTDGFWANHHRVAHQLLTTPRVDFAVRIAADAGRLERTVAILAPGARADDAELLRSSLLSLNMCVEDSVACPADLREHDEIATAFPPLRWRLRRGVYPHRGYELVDDFRLLPVVPDLLQAALTRRWRLAYQLNVRRDAPRLDDRRWLRKNLVRVEEDRALPQPLLALQRRVADAAERSAFLVEEFIGVDGADAGARVLEIAVTAFGRGSGGTGLPAPEFEVEHEGEFEDLIASGLHSASVRDFATTERIGAAATADEVASVLEWRPPETWATLLANAARSAGRPVDRLERIEARLAGIERAIDRLRATSREFDELKEAVELSRGHPGSALAKARLILERIVKAVYADRKPGQRAKPLFNMIEELTETAGVFPRKIGSYLHTLRVLGNLVVHDTEAEHAPPSEIDVELALLMVVELVAWYLLEYADAKRSP